MTSPMGPIGGSDAHSCCTTIVPVAAVPTSSAPSTGRSHSGSGTRKATSIATPTASSTNGTADAGKSTAHSATQATQRYAT